MKKTLVILVGIPCAGKSTYVEKTREKIRKVIGSAYDFSVISRDNIRLQQFGKDYIPTMKKEEVVTRVFDQFLEADLDDPQIAEIILDNTHCKEKYINEIINRFKHECHIEIRFFDVPLWLAHVRNIYRWIKTRKWIPMRVINDMYRNYNKINREKYAEYMVHE